MSSYIPTSQLDYNHSKQDLINSQSLSFSSNYYSKMWERLVILTFDPNEDIVIMAKQISKYIDSKTENIDLQGDIEQSQECNIIMCSSLSTVPESPSTLNKLPNVPKSP